MDYGPFFAMVRRQSTYLLRTNKPWSKCELGNMSHRNYTTTPHYGGASIELA